MNKSLGIYKDMTSLTRRVKYFLYITIIINIALIAVSFLKYKFYYKVTHQLFLSEESYIAAANINALILGLVGIFYIFIFVITGVLILKWIYWANYNVRQLGAEGMEYTPGWSVGWYFIPIASLWVPYKSMCEIWKASVSPENWKPVKRHIVIEFWWCFWLISGMISWLTFQSLEGTIRYTVIDVLSCISAILACCFFLFIVSKISSMQISWAKKYQIKISNSYKNFESSNTLTLWVKRGLSIGILLNIALLIVHCFDYQFLCKAYDYAFSSQEALIAAENASQLVQNNVEFISGVFFILVCILMLMWVYRANYNARQLGANDMEFSSAWSIGWYFIPIACLYMPFESMKETWKASTLHPNWRNNKTHPILIIWWFFWIGFLIVDSVLFYLSYYAFYLEDYMTVGIVKIISDICGALLFLSTLILVSKIHKRQKVNYTNSDEVSSFLEKKSSKIISNILWILGGLSLLIIFSIFFPIFIQHNTGIPEILIVLESTLISLACCYAAYAIRRRKNFFNKLFNFVSVMSYLFLLVYIFTFM